MQAAVTSQLAYGDERIGCSSKIDDVDVDFLVLVSSDPVVQVCYSCVGVDGGQNNNILPVVGILSNT